MRSGLALSLAFGLGCLAGCGRVESAADRHASEMRESIGDIVSEQDRDARRFELEASEAERAAKPPAPKKATSSTPPAMPRTVQLGEGEEQGSDDPNDPTQRPEIKLQGVAGPSMAPSRPSRRSRRDREVEEKADKSDKADRADKAAPAPKENR